MDWLFSAIGLAPATSKERKIKSKDYPKIIFACGIINIVKKKFCNNRPSSTKLLISFEL